MASDEITLMRGISEGRMSRREALKRGVRGGLSLAALASVLAVGSEASAKKKVEPIGPNCIFVCCDDKCDDFCLKCFDWPKPKKAVLVRR